MAGRAGEVRILGVNELVRAFGNLDKQLKKALQKELVVAGEIVRDDVRQYWSSTRYPNPKSIAGFRVGARMGNIRVYQRYSPGPTGTRGDFGMREMASMAYGLKKMGPKVEVAVERTLDRLLTEQGLT